MQIINSIACWNSFLIVYSVDLISCFSHCRRHCRPSEELKMDFEHHLKEESTWASQAGKVERIEGKERESGRMSLVGNELAIRCFPSLVGLRTRIKCFPYPL